MNLKISAFYPFVVLKFKKYSSIYFVAQVLVPYRFCTNGKQKTLFCTFEFLPEMHLLRFL